MKRRAFVNGTLAAMTPPERETVRSALLAEVALKQLGIVTGYDPRYVSIAYPKWAYPRTWNIQRPEIYTADRVGLKLDLGCKIQAIR